MLSPRSQSKTQFVPVSNNADTPSPVTSATAGHPVNINQQTYTQMSHQGPSSATSSVSSTLSQMPLPTLPHTGAGNYTTTTQAATAAAASQLQAGTPSYTLAPAVGQQFFYDQNPLHYGQNFQPPQHQQGQAQQQAQGQQIPQQPPQPQQVQHPFYHSAFPVYPGQPQPQPHQLPAQHEYFGALTSMEQPQLHQAGHSLVSEERPFPGMLDTQYHPQGLNFQQQRSATYPMDNVKSTKRSGSASSNSSTGPLGMTEETARRNRCPRCQKQFKRPSSLQTHMYSHTGEKPFKCSWPSCGRMFSVRSNMIRHRKLHDRDSKLKSDDEEYGTHPGSSHNGHTGPAASSASGHEQVLARQLEHSLNQRSDALPPVSELTGGWAGV